MAIVTNNTSSGSGHNAIQSAFAAQQQRAYSSTDYAWSGSRFEVIEAANGYVLRVASQEGTRIQTYIARDINELRDLITTDLVANKLGK